MVAVLSFSLTHTNIHTFAYRDQHMHAHRDRQTYTPTRIHVHRHAHLIHCSVEGTITAAAAATKFIQKRTYVIHIKLIQSIIYKSFEITISILSKLIINNQITAKNYQTPIEIEIQIQILAHSFPLRKKKIKSHMLLLNCAPIFPIIS